MNKKLPNFKTKLFFWITLGCISTFFAEVIAGSFRFPFLPNIDAWGVICVIPLYTFHILVLGYIVYNYGKPRFYTLFIAGAIFGMYEAYATGVLWTGWAGLIISIFGLGIIETIMLVLFWHPLMSFILPTVIGETLLTNTKESLVDIKKFTTMKFLVFFTIILGFFQSFNISSPILALYVGLANIPVIALLIFIGRKINLNKYSMKELLPNKKQFKIIFILMISQYIFFGLLNADKIPNLASQSFVWLIYLILFFLLYKALKKSRDITKNTQGTKITFSWKIFALLSVILVSSSMIFSILFNSIRSIIWGFLLLFDVSIGLSVFLYSLNKIFKKS